MEHDYTAPSWTDLERREIDTLVITRAKILTNLEDLLRQSELDARSDEFRAGISAAINAVRAPLSRSPLG
jgi:hypothetical protein